MPGAVGYDVWRTPECKTVFVVKNICAKPKRVRIFSYPVEHQGTRDLMRINFLSEADIRNSLLKGELHEKIKNGELTIIESNIDLLQFDECQYDFLRSAGIVDGLKVAGGASDGYSFPVVFRQAVPLIGTFDGVNRIFTIPNSEKFVNGSVATSNVFLNHEFRILIRHNGRGLVESTDFIVAESGGSGTGFDTIIFISLTPKPRDNGTLVADYVVKS